MKLQSIRDAGSAKVRVFSVGFRAGEKGWEEGWGHLAGSFRRPKIISFAPMKMDSSQSVRPTILNLKSFRSPLCCCCCELSLLLTSSILRSSPPYATPPDLLSSTVPCQNPVLVESIPAKTLFTDED